MAVRIGVKATGVRPGFGMRARGLLAVVDVGDHCTHGDLGAGGIACATSELAAAGGCGAAITLDDAHRVERPLAPEVL